MKATIGFAEAVLVLGACVQFQACASWKRGLVVRETKPLIESVQKAFLREGDLEANKQSLPTMIKLAEGFLGYHPKSPYYDGKLCFMLAAYGFAFLDETPFDDLEAGQEAQFHQLMETYNKAYNYGKSSLNKVVPNFLEALKSPKQRKKSLAKLGKKHNETLFWFNFATAMLVFNKTSDPKWLLELDTIKAVAEHLQATSPDYLLGANACVLMAYYGGRSDAIGGDFNKSKEHYTTAKRSSKGQLLLADYVYMRFVLTQQNDPKAFSKTFADIQAFELKPNDPYLFLNKALKAKAARLHAKKNWLF